MSETTSESPVSAEQLAQAQARVAAADAWLNDPANAYRTERAQKVGEKIAGHATMRRAAEDAKARQQTAPTLTPDEQIALIRTGRDTRQALREEVEGSPLTAPLLDKAIADSVRLHAGDHVPGTYTDADLRGVTREAGLTDQGHMLFGAALDRLGVSAGAERMRLGFALRDAVPEDEGALTEEVMAARVVEWWGDGPEADAKLAAADRAWLALTRTERLALNSRRGSRVFMEAMAQLGQKLPRR